MVKTQIKGGKEVQEDKMEMNRIRKGKEQMCGFVKDRNRENSSSSSILETTGLSSLGGRSVE